MPALYLYLEPKIKIVKNLNVKQKKLLLEYCSKDTLALYYLIKYFFDES